MSEEESKFNPGKLHSDRERWICIYPAYINKKKTLAGGRRIPRDNAVDDPVVEEMRDVLAAAGLRVAVEGKVYSRERSTDTTSRGRVRVQLRNDDGSAVDGRFPRRESVMTYLARMIPQLKSRSGKQKGSELPGGRPVTGATKKKGKSRK